MWNTKRINLVLLKSGNRDSRVILRSKKCIKKIHIFDGHDLIHAVQYKTESFLAISVSPNCFLNAFETFYSVVQKGTK